MSLVLLLALFVTTAECRADEYAVFSDFLSAMRWERYRSKTPIRRYVIRERTDAQTLGGFGQLPWRITDNHRARLRVLEDSTCLSFETLNAQPMRLDAKQFPGISVTLISEEEYNASFPSTPVLKGPPRQIWQEYADSPGVLALSRVGFSNDGKQAVLYFDQILTGQVGRGGLAVLTRERKERWTIRQLLTVRRY